MAILKVGLEIIAAVLYERELNEPKELTARLSAARKVRARNAFIVAAARK